MYKISVFLLPKKCRKIEKKTLNEFNWHIFSLCSYANFFYCNEKGPILYTKLNVQCFEVLKKSESELLFPI